MSRYPSETHTSPEVVTVPERRSHQPNDKLLYRPNRTTDPVENRGMVGVSTDPIEPVSVNPSQPLEPGAPTGGLPDIDD